mmetsp:Transcript_44942/g.94296  ORF Transcript_44942/g.94296 Transcript_44942/m.94296 type:complete len:117 (-) Transcript_44942:68-418(-)
MTPPPTPRDSLVADDALASVNAPPAGVSSPIGHRRLSYAGSSIKSKRQAILHASPPKGGESPVKKASRHAHSTAVDSRTRRDGPFNPVADSLDPSPRTVLPPDNIDAPSVAAVCFV